MEKLTKEEKAAVNTLNRLHFRWPDSLWIFANGNGLSIMKCKPNGDRAMTDPGSVDQDYIIATIDIPCDGGDF